MFLIGVEQHVSSSAWYTGETTSKNRMKYTYTDKNHRTIFSKLNFQIGKNLKMNIFSEFWIK